ncbi:hypothetical protein BAU15_14830 [Enterococcus sp. JM4C]|uniref:metallophosphoesterase n=1 Tax=Candidatus Enterococcus huntleyi TaxID=1857217 RepID=UPI00137B8D28|nr:metallophosphoesterase [Enterococcus sp. JM4C]KAF1296613.1 hypothetical protein BAU15_14830 [Enterococcus sp. JM4C]
MKTLLVGDIHLKAQIILPMVEQKIRHLSCYRVILLGDYMDAYNQNRNISLYMDELDYILMWQSKMQVLGVEVITLMGNHDAPYLINQPKMFSIRDADGFIRVKKKLLKLKLQIAFLLDEYVVSHAGYTQDYDLEDWHLTILNENTLEKVDWLDKHVGASRGGEYLSGSPLWADFEQELCMFPNPNYPKQIVGHTPQRQIHIMEKSNFSIAGIDTFQVTPIKTAPYYELFGNGEILLYENDTLCPVDLDWENESVIKKIDSNFYRSGRIAVVGGIIFDFEKWSVTVNKKEFLLTNEEFDIFVYLFEREGKEVLEKDLETEILYKYEKIDSVNDVIFRLNSKIQSVVISPGNKFTFRLK